MRWVVRVPLAPSGRLSAYRCPGARIGDLVEVYTPFYGAQQVRVVGYGRRGWIGRLKRARLIERGPEQES